MVRVLHIARATTPAAGRTAAAIARESGLRLWLVRPRDAAAAALARDEALAGVRLVRCWRRRDPHRGLFATLTFGMRQASPDIVHAEEEPDSLAALQVAAARRAIAPSARLVLHTWQNVDRPKRLHVKGVMAATLRAADAVLCASETAVTLLRSAGFAGPAAVILPAGFDPETFRPRDPRRLASLADEPSRDTRGGLTVGYVGRLAPEKGVETLVSAVGRLDGAVRLRIAGSGPLEGSLARQAATEAPDGRVLFTGRLDAGGVADFLSEIDVLVLPSRTTGVWAEQFGRVLVEAMACGTPVVGSTSGEIPAVIGDAGLVFPEGDTGALAERLEALRRSPELRARLSERGLERARARYSATGIARQTASFYRELAALPRGVSR